MEEKITIDEFKELLDILFEAFKKDHEQNVKDNPEYNDVKSVYGYWLEDLEAFAWTFNPRTGRSFT